MRRRRGSRGRSRLCTTAVPATVTVNLSAGGSTTVGPFDTGTSCAVSEPTLPTAPSGWTFGTPSISGSPATIVKGAQAAAVEVTVTNSITRDTRKFQDLEDDEQSGWGVVAGGVHRSYDCGTGYTGTFSVASGGSADGEWDPDRQHVLGGRDGSGRDRRVHVGGADLHTGVDRDLAPRVARSRSWSATRSPVTADRSTISKTVSQLRRWRRCPRRFAVNYNCGTGYTGQVSVPRELRPRSTASRPATRARSRK